MKLLLEIKYDGKNYHGWQVQPGCKTVQKTVQDSLECVLGKRYNVTGCSRTDSGVHARQFFCTVDGVDICKMPPEKIPHSLSAVLPPDISAVSCKAVTDDFHARYSCKGKEYEYIINASAHRDPFLNGRAWQLCRLLDTEAMERAAAGLVGKHDFTSFCASNASTSDNVRTVEYCRVTRDEKKVKINILADGFLYNMVRIIAGTLVFAGLGKIEYEDTAAIIKKCCRAAAGSTAPAEGLYLNKVIY